jgi:hypothetical protein
VIRSGAGPIVIKNFVVIKKFIEHDDLLDHHQLLDHADAGPQVTR